MKNILAVMIVCFALNCQAQDNLLGPKTPKSFLGISAGISSPLGTFSRHNIIDYFLYSPSFQKSLQVPSSNQGFANNGFNISGDGVFYLSENFGMSMSIMYAENAFYTKPFENDFHNTNIQYPPLSGSFTATSYSHFAFMLGPVAGLELSDQLSVDVRAMLGLLTTSFPTQDIVQTLNDSATTDPIRSHFHVEAPSSTTVCFVLGGFMRYHPKFGEGKTSIHKKRFKQKEEAPKNYQISFFFHPEFILSSQVFETSMYEADEYNNSSRNVTSPVFNLTFNQPVNLLHFSIGIAYEFK